MPLQCQVRSSLFEYFYRGFVPDHIITILIGSHTTYTRPIITKLNYQGSLAISFANLLTVFFVNT